MREQPSFMTRSCLCGSHLPLLMRAFTLSEGDVLEMGTGWFSTMVLRWLCEMSGRTLYSYETSNEWYKRATRKKAPFHKVIKIDSWDDAEIDNKRWGLVLIDHAPCGRRRVEIERLANLADYMVIHDTNPQFDKAYRYSKIWHLFKNRYDFTKYYPHSTVVSNFYSLEKFKE